MFDQTDLFIISTKLQISSNIKIIVHIKSGIRSISSWMENPLNSRKLRFFVNLLWKYLSICSCYSKTKAITAFQGILKIILQENIWPFIGFVWACACVRWWVSAYMCLCVWLFEIDTSSRPHYMKTRGH